MTMFFMCFDKHCHVQLRILWEGEFVAKCLKCHVDWSIKRLKGSGHGTRAHTHTHSHTHTHATHATATAHATAHATATVRVKNITKTMGLPPAVLVVMCGARGGDL